MNRLLIVTTALLLCFCHAKAQQKTYTVSGYMLDKQTGQPILGGQINVQNSTASVIANSYGFYSITLDSGWHVLESQQAGYDRDTMRIWLGKDETRNILLTKTPYTIGEATVIARRNVQEVKSTRISVINLKPADIRNIPTIGGELDIIKVAQLLPGIQKGAEGQSGFQVRGGDPDQNLILLDEATVYNISHLFGFFSVFIPEAIEDMDIYKGGFPAEYGGRLSSILDIRMKDGNRQRLAGSGGIGILSSRLTLEGPIVKDKASFILSGRRTYIDRVFKLAGLTLPYYFYDMNARLNWTVDKKNKLFYSFYLGNDVLKENSEQRTDSGDVLQVKFGFQLGNITNTLRWNHIFNPKLFCNTSFINTRFRYYVSGEFGDNSIFIGSRIYDYGIKSDFTWYKKPGNTIKYGISAINHTFKPNVISAKGVIEELLKDSAGKVINTQETGVYLRSEKQIKPGFKINYGARISACFTEGKLYAGLEPRVAAVYETGKYSAIKFGYARMKQYLHLVSSSSVSLPTDLWYPVTRNIKPQRSDQWTLGYQHAFRKPDFLFSAEVYYKTMQNTTEYREGAVLILNNNYENELLQGNGRAYGAEFLLKRDKGKLNGWIGYTLSYSDRHFTTLNGGNRFPAKYDRRHSFSLVANYVLSKRWDLGLVWVYNSGSRFTAQTGKYFMPNPSLTGVDVVPVYSSRNAVRMSASHRLDLNLVLKCRQTKKFKTEWVFSAYNTYNRAEPYRVRIVADKTTGALKYEQPGLFGTLCSIAYNFRF
ncbi:MAG: TonB-dependent receptor plug domain-containing protein [Bacteroidetes bacterium]|nr:TonB-dependent receptor plug domain-containing protein [Bacteroidota bacterium]